MIAVIGILAAILIPVVGNARTSAQAAKSRAMFTQIASACLTFKADYGYWPCDDGDSLETDGVIDILSASDASGVRDKNRRMITYYSPSEYTEDGNYVIDAFGNSDIRIVFADTKTKIPTISINGKKLQTGNPDDNPSGRENLTVNKSDIHAKIAVFSAGDGKKVVGSWSD